MIPWLRPLVFMWLLLRIDDNWEPVIIGGYDTEQYCRNEAERSLWGRVSFVSRPNSARSWDRATWRVKRTRDHHSQAPAFPLTHGV